MENQDLISPKKEPEEIKVVDPGFVDDEGNIAIRHLYGEIIWLKSYEYPHWPAIVLDPRWLPLSLVEELKLNKKKAHNRIIAQFYDDQNSLQIVGMKNVSYPFDAFYDLYKDNEKINPEYILKAKTMSELSRINRCHHHNPDMKESDLLMVNTCIVCHKPIEDLDPIDIRISGGKTCVENPEKHFHDKSYLRCSNPQCLSLFHKACVPNATVNDRCSICKIEPPPEKRKQSIHIIEEKEKKREMDDARSRRHESRREIEEDERKGIKRQPVRSTRAPTYHEEAESSEEDEKKTPSKKRKLASARSKSTDLKANSSSKENEITFERIHSEDVNMLIKDLFLSAYDKKILKAEESSYVKNLKRKCRSVVAWFSTFEEPQQQLIIHFFMLLSNHHVEQLKEFASQVVRLLEKKLMRHKVNVLTQDFINNVSIYDNGLEGKRLDFLRMLRTLLIKPEFALICRFIEYYVFCYDSSLGEGYDKMTQLLASYLQKEEIFDDVISGTLLVKEFISTVE